MPSDAKGSNFHFNDQVSLFENIPSDVIVLIMSFLKEPADIVHVSQLNKFFKNLSDLKTARLWQMLIARHFPYLKEKEPEQFESEPYTLYKQEYEKRCKVECESLNLSPNEWLEILSGNYCFIEKKYNSKALWILALSSADEQQLQVLEKMHAYNSCECKLAYMWAAKIGNNSAFAHINKDATYQLKSKLQIPDAMQLSSIRCMLENTTLVEEKRQAIQNYKNAKSSFTMVDKGFKEGIFELQCHRLLSIFLKETEHNAFLLAAQHGQKTIMHAMVYNSNATELHLFHDALIRASKQGQLNSVMFLLDKIKNNLDAKKLIDAMNAAAIEGHTEIQSILFERLEQEKGSFFMLYHAPQTTLTSYMSTAWDYLISPLVLSQQRGGVKRKRNNQNEKNDISEIKMEVVEEGSSDEEKPSKRAKHTATG